ncbi:hypothetical protein B0H14DRAFT_2677564 [Mycena olivaceomarginata]|uniref:Stress-associated endoplasmic reticulum protein n=1 Tax=Mycena albidolilacea TaxID=1033008 RepID=A0AAD7AKB3_9AGAR|nr:hypothetical protein DFH08DRAFT_843841 [Mycena albidolilacea]KAJ7897261.1 hypothetical protein B0H14DRAFT_2677564 [Mycena olivaceomarginata]
MPTEFEMRQRNAKFANTAKSGKKPTHPSRAEQLAKRSPLNVWALGVVVFVVIGGVIFQIVRLLFLD